MLLPVFAARAAAVVMVVVAAFQVALVFGAPWGAYTQGSSRFCLVERAGIEPATSGLQSRRSPS